jgi:MSHA biogenesis protein MshO
MRATQAGFTLVEMVVVIVVATIVAGFTAFFISTPVEAYFAQVRRAELADSAEAIVRNVGEDVRVALPNSVRTASNGTVVALEMLAVVDVLRYRQAGELGGNAARELDFMVSDTQFSTLGTRNNPLQAFAYFVVNNRGAPGADAYQLSNVITPVGAGGVAPDAVNAGESVVTLNPGFRFQWGAFLSSPSRSVFLVSGPVTYLCDTGAQTLWRYEGYLIAGTVSTNAAGLAASSTSAALIARNVTACQISVTQAKDLYGDLVTLSFTLANSGETFPLFYQAHVERRP